MNNFKKVGLTALAGALVSVSANAADVAVSGGASISFAGEEKTTAGNGWSMNNGITFSMAGEMDNGFTWSYSTELDPGDGGAATNDDSQLVIGMGDMGTIGFFDSEGGLSQELGYGIGALGTGYDWGSTMTVQAGLDVSSHPNVQYHLPADVLPFGMTAKVGYVPNMADGQGNSFKNSGPINPEADAGNQMTGYSITAAPVDGLKIGADYHETSGAAATTAQEAESGNYFAQYAMGNFKTVSYTHLTLPTNREV